MHDINEKILNLFRKKKDSYLSGEEVAGFLNISRQALWKHIEKLREIGYGIEAVPHLGYKLLKVPDKLLAEEVKWNLKTKVIGKEFHFYESVGSTNAVAYEAAEKGAPEGACFIADEQTRGRGRLGRTWTSPEGGIYLSCVLRPDILPNEVSKATLIAAVSSVKAIREFTGVKALIKWPNDILISDRKAGGILTELKGESDRIGFLVLGIGINVNTPKRSIPEGGTSLKEESKSGSNFSRVEFVKILLEELEREYMKFKRKGFTSLRPELKSYSCTLGRYISIIPSRGERVYGKAEDIDQNGAIVVKLENGSKRAFLSGDVTLMR